MSIALTHQLAKALQLPPRTVSATLQLETNRAPTLTAVCYVGDVDLSLVTRVFELRELEPAPSAQGPFDLDRLTSEAQARLKAFVIERAGYHSRAFVVSNGIGPLIRDAVAPVIKALLDSTRAGGFSTGGLAGRTPTNADA